MAVWLLLGSNRVLCGLSEVGSTDLRPDQFKSEAGLSATLAKNCCIFFLQVISPHCTARQKKLRHRRGSATFRDNCRSCTMRALLFTSTAEAASEELFAEVANGGALLTVDEAQERRFDAQERQSWNRPSVQKLVPHITPSTVSCSGVPGNSRDFL